WESAYREMHDVPALLIQLQDDLSRSRQREAFWISVVVHLAIIILVVNSPKFDKLMHHRALVMVSPQDLMRQKELTYLELPPDEQKLTKRPDTNKISDKDRVATSRTPQLDRRELKKILDSARPVRLPYTWGMISVLAVAGAWIAAVKGGGRSVWWICAGITWASRSSHFEPCASMPTATME